MPTTPLTAIPHGLTAPTPWNMPGCPSCLQFCHTPEGTASVHAAPRPRWPER